MIKWIKKKWNDSVWSKVFGQLITSAILGIISLIVSLILKMKKELLNNCELNYLPLIFGIIGIILLIMVIISLLLRRKKVKKPVIQNTNIINTTHEFKNHEIINKTDNPEKREVESNAEESEKIEKDEIPIVETQTKEDEKLIRIAINPSEHIRLRKMSLEKLENHNQDVFAQIALNRNDPTTTIREMAIDKLEDQDALAKIASEPSESIQIRNLALAKLDNKEALLNIAMNTNDPVTTIREKALEKINVNNITQ